MSSDTFLPLQLKPIAYSRSCYPERCGIPRQAGLVKAAYGDIVFKTTEENRLALRGIDAFSHLWVIFVFHHEKFNQHNRPFRPLVRPPRLEGNKSVGVYSSRSPNRPNPIGLSAVRLKQVTEQGQEILLRVQGGDFLDQTPVLDIKPYIAYADAIDDAHSGWAACQEPPLPVHWTQAAESALYRQHSPEEAQALRALVDETLALDPRPGYERGKDGRPNQRWNTQIDQYSLFWTVVNGAISITELTRVER